MALSAGSSWLLALIAQSFLTPVVSASRNSPRAEPYRVKQPLLSTPWTDDTVGKLWPQHPRPLLYRPSWESINGLWTYQPAEGRLSPNETGELIPDGPLAHSVNVPSCLESALSGIMEPEATYSWYQAFFEVPSDWLDDEKRVMLHFEAVDYEATVFINGERVATHVGGYWRFSVDITDHLKRDSYDSYGVVNTVHVHVFDPTDLDLPGSNIPTGKQSRHPSHIFYTPCSGIWQSVWLESVPKVHIRQLDVTADMHGKVTLNIHSSTNVASDVKVSVWAEGGVPVISAAGVSNQKLTFQVDDPHLWSPDSPTLYNLTVTMGDDTIETYTAFRTISTGTVDGIVRPLLNGEFVFWIGTLDQGYWPDGIYLPPTKEAMEYDIKLVKGLGMNMMRKHIKVELDLFYRACDEIGLLVIQDMPNMFPETSRRPPTQEQQAEWERQLEMLINEHKNYPSIAAWVIYNEGWGQKMEPPWPEEKIVEKVKRLDPTRLVDATSGWNDHGFGDFSDNHHYASPQCGTPFTSLLSIPFNPARIGFQGEFGGIGHNVSMHNLWPVQQAIDSINQTYEIAIGLEAYNYRAHNLFEELREQIEKYSCSGAVYTQTTDVEGEVNGLVTYDRKLVRVDEEQWKRDIRALFEAAAGRVKKRREDATGK